MEKKILDTFDSLNIEETENLPVDISEKKLSDLERHRIKKSVFKKIDSDKKNRRFIPKKLLAGLAAAALIFVSLAAIGFDNVAVAFNRLFTFIPGIGIEEKSDTDIYIYEPVNEESKVGKARARLVRAVYMNDYISVTVEVNGRGPHYDDYSFYINQEQRDYRGEHVSLSWSSKNSMLSFSYKTSPPEKDDLFEIKVAGFSEPLSFKLTLCKDFTDLEQIGPTVIKNGISITATAQRVDDKLYVWVYPFKAKDATKDIIVGYGQSDTMAFNNRTRYLESESGRYYHNQPGLQIMERLVFKFPQNDHEATLHIPYIAMLRFEKKKTLDLNLPMDYISQKQDLSLQTSLGTIKITEIKREANAYEQDKDFIRIKFDFDSKDEKLALYFFTFSVPGYVSSSYHSNPETGSLDFLELNIDKNTDKIKLNITGLFYYLFDEYVIPLDIK